MNDYSDIYFRQIHPEWVQGEVVALKAFSPDDLAKAVESRNFKPTEKDEGLLSTYNGNLTTPEKAYIHYTKILKSKGVLGVSKEECEELNLSVIEDGAPFPEHASIDFKNHGKAKQGKIAKRLRSKAARRGWLYPHE